MRAMTGKRSHGFTLIEVMVAMAIFAVLAVGVYRVLSVLVESRSRVVSHAQSLQDIQKAMWIIGNDVALAVMRDIAVDERKYEPAMVSEQNHFALQFTRQGQRNPLLFSRSDLLRVAYDVGPEPASMFDDAGDDEDTIDDNGETRDEKGKTHLLRTTWPALDRLSSTQPLTQVLIRDVRGMDVEFCNDEGKWVRQWPEKKPEGNDHARDLPRGVRLVLHTAQYGDIERVFQLSNIPKNKASLPHKGSKHQQTDGSAPDEVPDIPDAPEGDN